MSPNKPPDEPEEDRALQPVRLRSIGLIAGISAAALTLVLWLLQQRGTFPVRLPVGVVAVLLIAATIVLLLGLRIRRWLHRGDHIDPLGATRTLVLGQAAAIAGAIQAGYFVAQILLSLPRLHAPEPKAVLATAVVALIAAAVLVAAGLITQWCCRLPPEGEEDSQRPDPLKG